MMLWRAAALMAMTFCMTVSRVAACAALRCGKVLMRQSFQTSARKEENGFVQGEICFVAGVTTKHTRQNCEYFQCAENAVISAGRKFRPRQIGFVSGFLASRRKQVAAASDGA